MVLRGNSATTKHCLGTLKLARLALRAATTVSGATWAPGLAITTATPTSPKSGWGTPTKALSATPGISLMKLSTSAGYTL